MEGFDSLLLPHCIDDGANKADDILRKEDQHDLLASFNLHFRLLRAGLDRVQHDLGVVPSVGYNTINVPSVAKTTPPEHEILAIECNPFPR